MSSPDPDDGGWVYDSVPHYRLNENIVDGYLTKKWGVFKFYIQKTGNDYKFWVPRKLTDQEKEELLELRNKDE